MRRNDGQAMILVVMIIAMLYVVTASLGSIAGSTHENTVNEQEITQALYAADAGIENTIAAIIDDPNWYKGLNNQYEEVYYDAELNESSLYSTKILKSNNNSQLFGTTGTIESVGQYIKNNKVAAQKTVHCNVAVYTIDDYFKGFSIIPEKPVEMEINGNATFNSPFIYRGDLTLGGSVSVSGNNPVYTSGSLDLSGGASCNENNIIENYPYIPPFPELNSDYYKNLAEDAGLYHKYTSSLSSADFTFPNSHTDTKTITIPINNNKTEDKTVYIYSDYYYVDGDLTISGVYQGSAVIFVTGDITIENDLFSVNDDFEADTGAGRLTLIASGNIVIENSEVYANLMTQGGFQAWGNASLHGAICASGAEFGGGHGGGSQGGGGGNFEMYFNSDSDVDDSAIPVVTKILDWQELYPVFAD